MSGEPKRYYTPVDVNPEVVRLMDKGVVTREDWAGLRANSYDRVALLPYFDDALLAEHAEYCISQSGGGYGQVASSYDESVIHWLAPLLIQRLRRANARAGAVEAAARAVVAEGLDWVGDGKGPLHDLEQALGVKP